MIFPTGASGGEKLKLSFAALQVKSYKFSTPLPIEDATIVLNIIFDGAYSKGCGITFNIEDTEPMYHLDLRINDKYSYKKLVQSYKLSTWQPRGSYEDMDLMTGDNSVKVKVDDDFFRVWLNGVKYQDSVPVDKERLEKYSHLTLYQAGACANVDLETSFVEFQFPVYGKYEL